MITVKLRVKFKDAKKATAVHEALRPDDVDLPSHLEASSRVVGSILEYNFKFVGPLEKVWTLRNTVDEVLSLVKVLDESLKEVEK